MLIPSREQVSCPMEGDTAILNLKDGEYYELNAVGSRVWELIREPRTFGALHAQMLEEFEVEAESLRQDLLELLQEMAEKGLVEIRAQEGA